MLIVCTVKTSGGEVIKFGAVQAGMDHPSEAVTGEATAEVIEKQMGDETCDPEVTGNGKVRLV